MLPHDVYNRRYDAATEGLDAWLRTLRDVADIDRESTPSFWRARLRPHQPNTCPTEVLLTRQQTFDLEVGIASVSAQPITDFTLFMSLLRAVAEGHVVERCWTSVATGCVLARDVIVGLPEQQVWSMRRVISAGTDVTEQSAVARNHVFVPYRRA